MAQITLNSTGVASNGTLALQSNGTTTAVTINTSQNVGIGVTPSTWYSSYGTKAFQFAASGALYGLDVSNSDRRVQLSNNEYLDSAGAATYINTGAATRYQQTAGEHRWFSVASGSGGTAAALSQNMTLDVGGNLGVGTTSPSVKIDAQGTAAAAYIGQILTNNSSTGYTQHGFNIGPSGANGKAGIFYAPSLFYKFGVVANDTSTPITFVNNNDTERARIDSSGRLLVGATSSFGSGFSTFQYLGSTYNGISVNQTDNSSGSRFMTFAANGASCGVIDRVGATSAVVYTATSDYRLKNVTGAVTGQGERIDALKPIDYQWKEDNSQARGFLAHEFQTVYPNSLTGSKDALDKDGNPKYQAIQASSSEVIADLVAEIQSLRQRLSAANL
jgi:hypothetical protein